MQKAINLCPQTVSNMEDLDGDIKITLLEEFILNLL